MIEQTSISKLKNKRDLVNKSRRIFKTYLEDFEEERKELENKIATILEKEVFKEHIPVDIYGGANQLWFEFDILGLDLDDEMKKKIEYLTNSELEGFEKFYFKEV